MFVSPSGSCERILDSPPPPFCMLALGMCASVAIFAFVDAALIKPLPYPNPARLVGVYESIPMISRAQPFVSRLPRLEKTQQSFQLAGCMEAERFHAEDSRRRATGAWALA